MIIVSLILSAASILISITLLLYSLSIRFMRVRDLEPPPAFTPEQFEVLQKERSRQCWRNVREEIATQVHQPATEAAYRVCEPDDF